MKWNKRSLRNLSCVSRIRKATVEGDKKNNMVQVMESSKIEGCVFFDPVGNIFVGPSVEGIDKEYIKVVSGKVVQGKPSFAIK